MKTGSFPVRLLRLLMDPRVSREKKILFPVLIAAYWLLPDLMPFLPLDDLLFTIIMTYWFANSAEKDTFQAQGDIKGEGPSKASGKYVDVEGKVMEDKEE